MTVLIRVIPNAKSNSIRITDAKYTLRIKAKPVEGECNKELISFLHKSLEIKKRDIKIIRGEKSREKVLDINVSIKIWDEFVVNNSI